MNNVLHLYNRLGFGLPPSVWGDSDNKNLETAIAQLFDNAKNIKTLPSPDFEVPDEKDIDKMSEEQKRELRRQAENLTADVNLSWLRQMADDKCALREKMTFFWHGHFACESKPFHLAVRQCNTLRQHALGNFRDLVLAIAKDASMIFYLNNQQNRKRSPNENFARELMELFTLGRGNYTENDIKEAARAFTGWFADRRTASFSFDEKNHDDGSKTFMGKTGNWDGDDIIDIILEQKQVATFIAQKVYRFFVNDTPNAQHIEFLADKFRDSKYDISAMMRALASSDFLYAETNKGNKIISPIELIVKYMQIIGLQFETSKDAVFIQRALGQQLFAPPNVAGWAGGKNWIDNATLLLRLNLPTVFFQNADIDFKSKDDPEAAQAKERTKNIKTTVNIEVFKKFAAKKPVADWANYLLTMPYSYANSPVAQSLAQNSNKEEETALALLAYLSLPEFQCL